MAEGLILEFDGVGRDQYDAVNGRLGIDPNSASGDWPDGLVAHLGAGKPNGWVVVEVWQSREQQEAFMRERLGAALQEAGVPAPSRAEWLELGGFATPGG
jgi:hypothetical protein